MTVDDLSEEMLQAVAEEGERLKRLQDQAKLARLQQQQQQPKQYMVRRHVHYFYNTTF